MALGEILRNARIQKGLTPSDVAESTHMLVQIVESLEHEDFRRIAAPIYGRGFVKLYAELLELDSEPLISDFMNLYDGARAPAVRTKKVEVPCESVAAPEPTPVTRTVSGPAALRAPLRQLVQPRPAVRPLAVVEDPAEVAPLGEEALQEEAMRVHSDGRVVAEKPVDRSAKTAASVPSDLLVVEPEEPYVEVDTMDLFRSKPPQNKPDLSQVTAAEGFPAEAQEKIRKHKHPVFQIGGRMEKNDEPVPLDEAAHARRHARIKTFLDGMTKLKDGVERKLPVAWPRKQVVLFGGAGILMVVAMIAGIRVLFKMTGTNVKEEPGKMIERVAPPPPLYVD